MSLSPTPDQQLAAAHAAPPELIACIDALARAGRRIAWDLRAAGLGGLLGSASSTSHQGEDQQRMDLRADQLIEDELVACGQVGVFGSEEREQPVVLREDGRYAVLVDPLDGSSNIDASIATGTIFAIYERVAGAAPMADLSQPGHKQVAAGYVLFSSATVLVVATQGRVDGFTLDPAGGDFRLSHPAMTMAASGKFFSCNEGYADRWDAADQAFVASFRREKRGRYIGSLVADFHRNLLYNGLFLYPADCSSGAPKPKLRLCYEGNPLAFVAEAANGAGSNGTMRLLDIAVTDLHQREVLALGPKDDVSAYDAARRGE